MIVITWKVDDGYINPGPQESSIDESEIFEDDMSEAEKSTAIDEFIQEEFQQTISWFISSVEYE